MVLRCSAAMCEVEVVVKDIDGASFHRGVMIDVETKRGALVQLVAQGEQRWLPRNAMRLRREPEPPKGFQPRVGELVEVQVIETDDDEPFYRLAEIRRERDGIYFVRYGGPRGTRHDSVDRRRIRPSFGLQPAVGDYAKREIKMPKLPKGAAGFDLDFEAICTKSGALAMHEYPERPSVVALGTAKAVSLAEMLVELSIEQQSSRASLLAAKEEAKASQPRYACQFHADFTGAFFI